MPANDDVKGALLEPSAVNTPIVRALAILGTIALAAASTTYWPKHLVSYVHLSSYAILLGTMVFNTFFVGLTMFKAIPRQMFGRVQMKLFPKYFALIASMNVLLLGSLLVSSTAAPAASFITALGVGLAATVINWLGIEPIATNLLVERYALENKGEKTMADEERIKTLFKEFGKWHGMSSLMNLVALIATLWYGSFLAGRLAF